MSTHRPVPSDPGGGAASGIVADDLLAGVPDVVALVNAGGVVIHATPLSQQVLGYDPIGTTGLRIFDLVHPKDVDQARADFATAAVGEGTFGPFVFRIRAADGVWRTLETTVSNQLSNPSLRAMVFAARDVTDRAQYESALRFVAASHRVLIRATDEQLLLQDMCRVAVDEGSYQFAWVGYAQSGPERLVTSVAAHGIAPGYLDSIRVTWDDTPSGHGPAGGAIRTGRVQVIADADTDPAFAPFRAQAQAIGFRSLIGLPFTAVGHPPGVLAIYSDEPSAFDPPSVRTLQDLVDDLSFGLERLGDRARVERLLDQTLAAVGAVVEHRDPSTAGHERRVAHLAASIAEQLGADAATIEGVRTAGAIHDIGKVSISAEILGKPSRLSSQEFEIVKGHVLAGFDIVSRIDFPWPVAEAVLQHHERLDGSGYPNGLADDDISFGGRVIAVADVVEAMASHRPYRPSLGIAAALAEVRAGRGTLFDAAVVDACERIVSAPGFDLDDDDVPS